MKVTDPGQQNNCDYEYFYKTISNKIKDNGWLCIIDYHPFMLLNGIPTKFEDKETAVPYSIKNYIHSLSDHFNIAKNNNLKLIEFNERYVTDEWIDKNKSIEKYRGKSISFIMIFEKEVSKA